METSEWWLEELRVNPVALWDIDVNQLGRFFVALLFDVYSCIVGLDRQRYMGFVWRFLVMSTTRCRVMLDLDQYCVLYRQFFYSWRCTDNVYNEYGKKNMKESPVKRRKSRQVMVGDVPVGGNAPISVQSMTNTETTDVEEKNLNTLFNYKKNKKQNIHTVY